ncbi:hypothetical protein BaRGS_00035731, partial [Batillaria attramentaria]
GQLQSAQYLIVSPIHWVAESLMISRNPIPRKEVAGDCISDECRAGGGPGSARGSLVSKCLERFYDLVVCRTVTGETGGEGRMDVDYVIVSSVASHFETFFYSLPSMSV